MTIATASRRQQAGYFPVSATARLLGLELRRSAMVWLVPPLAVLMWFSPYQVSMEYAPIWDLRASVMLDHFLPLVAFGAGAAAWTGSRDTRRRTTDLVTVTPRPAWVRRLVSCAATTGWMLTAYAGLVAVLYGVTASCALGFAAGAFFPSRFTVPLAALVAGFLALMGISHSTNPYALLSGADGIPPSDVGVFYRYLPDLAIAQLMFLGGLAIAAAGALGLPAASGGRGLRRAAGVVTLAGLAAAGAAVGLTGTARVEPNGVVIPALHDAASGGPVSYTPVCSGAVCVHPAFRVYLGEVATALDPVLSEVAGLSGAPVGAEQVAASDAGDAGAFMRGSPPVFRYALPATSSSFIAGLSSSFVAIFIAGPGGAASDGGTAAQQAVESALLTAAGEQGLDSAGAGQQPASVSAAAVRFAARPAAVRQAWLAAHLFALRAGRVTLAQLP